MWCDVWVWASALQPHNHTITHSHTLTITCTCCYDQIKGTQDQDFSCSFSDSLSLYALCCVCVCLAIFPRRYSRYRHSMTSQMWVGIENWLRHQIDMPLTAALPDPNHLLLLSICWSGTTHGLIAGLRVRVFRRCHCMLDMWDATRNKRPHSPERRWWRGTVGVPGESTICTWH